MTPEIFNAYDVIKIAGEMEKKGAAIYQELGAASRQRTIADVFNKLSDQKKENMQEYKKLLQRVPKEAPQEAYPGEYIIYLRNLAQQHILDLKKAKKVFVNINTPGEALDFIITMKKSSLLYLQELQKHVSANDWKVVLDLIKQKQKGLNELSALKNKYQQLFLAPVKKIKTKKVVKKKKAKKIKKKIKKKSKKTKKHKKRR